MKKALLFLCLVAACHSTSRAERLDATGQHEKRPEKAVDDFTQAIELEPERAEFWLHRGLARERQQDTDGAIADFTRSIALVPRLETGSIESNPAYLATAYFHRARARRKKLLLDLALLDLAKAEELDPGLATAVASERDKVEVARTGKSSGD